MSVKRALRILGLGIIAYIGLYVAAVALEPLDWALRSLWQLFSESEKLVVVAVLVIVGTLVGIWEGASSTRAYHLKNRHLDDGSNHGCGQPE